MRFSKCKILVGKTLTIQRAFVKFRQTFPPSKFCAIRYAYVYCNYCCIVLLHTLLYLCHLRLYVDLYLAIPLLGLEN